MSAEALTRHASFPPVVDARTHTLILGSLPGAASLAARRYYAHPQNSFWRLLDGVYGLGLEVRAYDQRLALLQQHGVGLWDVIAQAERVGSLDASIRNEAVNDLETLVRSLPRLQVIGFNGGTAARIGMSQLGSAVDQVRIVRLPSSSPAHAIPFARKLEAWRALVPVDLAP